MGKPTFCYNGSTVKKGDILELVYLWVEDYIKLEKNRGNR
jgi:hypothetical protein